MQTRKRTTTKAARALGAYLRQLRNDRGLSMRKVEALTHCALSNAYLCQIESGQVHSPSPSALALLATVYKVKLQPMLAQVYPETKAAFGDEPTGDLPLQRRGKKADLYVGPLTFDEYAASLNAVATLRNKAKARAEKEALKDA